MIFCPRFEIFGHKRIKEMKSSKISSGCRNKIPNDRRPETIAFRKKRRARKINERIDILSREILSSKNSISICLVDHNGGKCPEAERIDLLRSTRIKDMEEELENLRNEMDAYHIQSKFEHITKDTVSFIRTHIPWGKLRGYEHDSFVITLRENDIIVAYAIIRHDEDGIVLDSEYKFEDIKDVIDWVEVKEEYRKKGYGATLVKYIRDLYYEKGISICLYAKSIPESTPYFIISWELLYYTTMKIILFTTVFLPL